MSCPPVGTEVSIRKLTNPAFLKDYSGCTVRTRVPLWDTAANGVFLVGVTEPDAFFFVVGGGESALVHVKLKKSAADVVFAAKRGDVLTIDGSPAAHPSLPNVVYFVATKVTR